eukprot:jgi/Tetstr1/459452/TSEL_004820.t1
MAARNAPTPAEMPHIPVDELLAAAASELVPGQLLAGEGFSLFEAMSAIVIGDPKMDGGLHRCDVPVDALLEGQAAPEGLSVGALLGVMDRLLQCEASWHRGSPLAQTVYTSLFLLRLERTAASPLLHTYCSGVQATAQLVRSLVLAGGVCMEEDFLPHTAGLPLKEGSSAGRRATISALESLEEALLGKWPGQELLLGPLVVAPEQASALAARLRFRRLLLLGLDGVVGGGIAGAEAAGRAFAGAAGELHHMAESARMGEPEPPGFHPDVNHSKVSAAPPRAVQLLTREESNSYFTTLLEQLAAVCQAVPIRGFTELQHVVVQFARRRPSPLSSSALYVLLRQRLEDPDDGLQQMLLTEFGCAGQHPQALPSAVIRVVQQAGRTVLAWVRIMCLNHGNQRRKLRRSAEDWAAVFNAAMAADQTGMPQDLLSCRGCSWPPDGLPDGHGAVDGPIATWVEVQAARVMLEHLQLGWELELYTPHEYCMIFWYSDYLLDVVATGSRVLMAAKHQQHPKKGKPAPAPPRELAHMQMEVFLMQVERNACQGFVRLLAGLRLAKLLPSDQGFYGDEAQRYHQRFSFLQLLPRPEPLWHEQYLSAMDTGTNEAPDMLVLAEQCFQRVRSQAELGLREVESGSTWESELTSLKRIGQQNTVGIAVLKTLMLKGASASISWDMHHHRHFPVLGIKQKV